METSKEPHENSFVCLLCDSVFNSNEELVYHFHCHNSRKPFSCTECENKYSYRTALKKHMNSHKIEKRTYACSKCGYECGNQIKLTDHQTAHSSEEKFSCDKCEFITMSKFSLSKHKREQSHGDYYECMDCNSLFKFNNAFAEHMKEVHQNHKPFACQKCVQCFSNNSHLKRHMKNHKENEVEVSEQNENYCENENEIFTEHQAENNITDLNNNIEQPSELPNNNANSKHVSKITKKCVSCHKNLKLKYSWGESKYDKQHSFELDDVMCELAFRQWELRWDNKNNERICVQCKWRLLSKMPYSSHSNKRGRPKVITTKPLTVPKKRKSKPVFVVNENDLNIQQSVSRLSSRQMHKLKSHWKSNLKNQGFKVSIAGQHRIDQLRKERVDDLFEVKEIMANVGSEKNPISKCINVVYCNNICELAKRIARHRNIVLDVCKLQGDHGQGSLKLSVQFTFSNSVNTLIILAITEESKESILTLKELEKLVNPQSLETNLGIRVLRTGDLQFLQLSIGVKTGHATYPCPFCNWRMTGENRNAVDAVCSPRNISKDLNEFYRLGSNRNLSHLVHGQQGEPAFLGDPVDVFVPPCLHINLGLVNHILKKMEMKHSEPFVQKELYEIAKVNKTSYQGGTFAGNEVQKIVKTFSMIPWQSEHPFKLYAKLFIALDITNFLVFTSKNNLTDDDIVDISLSIREVLIEWDCLKDSLGLSETVKLHVFAVHCLEFAIKHRCTPSAYGEQDGEMLHRRFKETLVVYKTLGKKALLHTVQKWNSWNF